MTAAPALPGRAERTRLALLEAGLALLVERPIDAIPIDDIVAAAGVAKGSFFNHFADKQQFGRAVAAYVREGLEAGIDAANAGVTDPVERLSGGMRMAAAFALAQRDRAIVMLRGLPGVTAADNPLNRGVSADLAAVRAAGLLRPEAEAAGVLFWLGLCQALVVNILEEALTADAAAERLRDMLVLGLAGLGIAPERAATVAAAAARTLRAG
jgi:AcrR family transcriptional regulator